jgi:hypothetical protein
MAGFEVSTEAFASVKMSWDQLKASRHPGDSGRDEHSTTDYLCLAFTSCE